MRNLNKKIKKILVVAIVCLLGYYILFYTVGIYIINVNNSLKKVNNSVMTYCKTMGSGNPCVYYILYDNKTLESYYGVCEINYHDIYNYDNGWDDELFLTEVSFAKRQKISVKKYNELLEKGKKIYNGFEQIKPMSVADAPFTEYLKINNRCFDLTSLKGSVNGKSKISLPERTQDIENISLAMTEISGWELDS